MKIERILLPLTGHLADANTRKSHPAEAGSWIWHPEYSRGQTAILRFNRRFRLSEGRSVVLHVTADQRFQLRCDGHDVSFGPDRCDVEHWTVQSLRLDLEAGEHEIEALVWWLGEPEDTDDRTDQNGSDPTVRPPMAQMTFRGGFLLYSDDLAPDVVNTGTAEWQVADLTKSVRLFRQRIPHYFDVGPSHEFDVEGWNKAPFLPAVTVLGPIQQNIHGVRRPGWCLAAAQLPEQRRFSWSGGRIRAVRAGWSEEAFSADEEKAADGWQGFFHHAGGPVEIPVGSAWTFIWDLEKYRCGYPLLEIEGGRDAKIEWDWAEALYEAPTTDEVVNKTTKGHRGEILGKSFLGYGDRWTGSAAGSLPYLWWRAGRYIRLRVAAGKEALHIRSLAILQTGYPLERHGEWVSSDAGWDALMPIFDNSYQCSAHEQWSDSPYYEQMSYVGDDVLHMLSNYAWYGDDRVSRRALVMFEWSRRASGLVAERYPSAWRQESTTYSMLWPMMLRDYMMWRDDPEFVRGLLPGLRSLMAETESLAGGRSLVGKVPGWPFVDWVQGWHEGCGPGVREGDSSIVNLHWVLSLQAAAEVEAAHGDPALADRCRRMARDVFGALLERYWDTSRGLLLDTAGQRQASEHAQFWALLTGLLNHDQTRSCLAALKGQGGTDLSPATIYAGFYLLNALYLHGEEEEFHRRLEFWRGLVAQGFTATPEAPEPSRSDAHAWGAHPAWHSLASIAGIRPAAPGYRRVRIAPCPGAMDRIRCSAVHPRGLIQVHLAFSGKQVSVNVSLPEGVSGEFVWAGEVRELPPGSSAFSCG
jgi:alpha-L-rhamnosidase